MASSRKFDLRALIYEDPDGEGFLAHCLEFDLVEGGETVEAAVRNLVDVTGAHVRYALETGHEEKLYSPAPDKFWRAFFAAQAMNAVPAGRRRTLAKSIQRLLGAPVVGAETLLLPDESLAA